MVIDEDMPSPPNSPPGAAAADDASSSGVTASTATDFTSLSQLRNLFSTFIETETDGSGSGTSSQTYEQHDHIENDKESVVTADIAAIYSDVAVTYPEDVIVDITASTIDIQNA